MGSIVRHDPRLASRHMNHGQIGHVEHTSKSSIWCTSAQTIDLKRPKKQLATYIYIYTYIYMYNNIYIYIIIYIYIYHVTDIKKRQQNNLQKQDVPHLHKSFRWSSCNWELALARSHWFTWKNIDLGGKTLRMIWGWVKTLAPSEPKIAGKWMFISLKMVCIGIDP